MCIYVYVLGTMRLNDISTISRSIEPAKRNGTMQLPGETWNHRAALFVVAPNGDRPWHLENNIDRDQSGNKWISSRLEGLTIAARKVFSKSSCIREKLWWGKKIRALEENTSLRNSLYKKCVQLIVKFPRSLQWQTPILIALRRPTNVKRNAGLS